MLEFVQQVVSTGMSHNVARHYVFHKLTCYACKRYGPVVAGGRWLPFLIYWCHVCVPPVVWNEACVVGSLVDNNEDGCNAGCEGLEDHGSYTVGSGSFVHFESLHHLLHPRCCDLMSVADGCGESGMRLSGTSPTLLNTDSNWVLSASAFSLGELMVFPFTFRVAMPVWSFLLLFTNCQNLFMPDLCSVSSSTGVIMDCI